MTCHDVSSEPVTEVAHRRTATWFELFCDLVFVAAVGQATQRVAAHPTWIELAATAALFVPLWWTWIIYTYHANRFDPDAAAGHRAVALVGMLGVCAVAFALPNIGSDSADLVFVCGYLIARFVPAGLYVLSARYDSRAHPIARRYATGSMIAAVGWIGGLLLPAGGDRVAAWALAMAVELGLPFAASRPVRLASHHVDHLKERFGLFTIIVLGEAILAVVAGLNGTTLEPSQALAAGFAFVVATGLWWIYFNSSSQQPGSHTARTDEPALRHVFTYGHLPAQLGIALAGAGSAVAIVSAPHAMPGPVATAIFGGVVVYLMAVCAVRTAFQRRLDAIATARLTAAGAVFVLLWIGLTAPAQVGLGLLAATMVGLVASETYVLVADQHRQDRADRFTVKRLPARGCAHTCCSSARLWRRHQRAAVGPSSRTYRHR